MLCGQKEDLRGFELWEHDIIVVTAGKGLCTAGDATELN
jgi:hypothetical protein